MLVATALKFFAWTRRYLLKQKSCAVTKSVYGVGFSGKADCFEHVSFYSQRLGATNLVLGNCIVIVMIFIEKYVVKLYRISYYYLLKIPIIIILVILKKKRKKICLVFFFMCDKISNIKKSPKNIYVDRIENTHNVYVLYF